MAIFKFSLATLLKVKEQFEQNAENELGIAVQAHEREKAALVALLDSLDDMQSEFRNALTGRIDHGRIEAIRVWIEALDSQRQNQEARVKKAAENVDIKRAKLIELVKERKVLEKLKEKEFQRYLAEEAAQEQKQIDELVTYKARRRTQEE